MTKTERYELVYGGGGHGGPYATLDEAVTTARRLLKGSSSLRVVYVVPYSAPTFHPMHAVETVYRYADEALVNEPATAD